MRKTVGLEFIKKEINGLLARPGSVAERQTLGYLLERVLFEANAYKGFAYLSQNEVPKNCEPGVIRDDTNRAISFPDDSRRCYL